MRLIDADALKEDFKSRLAECNEWIEKAKDKETKIRASAVKAFIAEVIMTIDNAPTIEPTFGMFRAMLCETCQAYATNRAIAKLADEYTKTRGEWEIVNTNEPDYHKSIIKCTNCGQKFNYLDLCKIAPVKCFLDFCPNCGADMREES